MMVFCDEMYLYYRFLSLQSSVMESTGLDSYNMDPDWLDSFLEDPVLNDRMMSDALQPPQPISNEHSYSLANGDGTDMDTIKHEPVDNNGM